MHFRYKVLLFRTSCGCCSHLSLVQEYDLIVHDLNKIFFRSEAEYEMDRKQDDDNL